VESTIAEDFEATNRLTTEAAARCKCWKARTRANVKQVDLLFALLKQIRRREIRRAKARKVRVANRKKIAFAAGPVMTDASIICKPTAIAQTLARRPLLGQRRCLARCSPYRLSPSSLHGLIAAAPFTSWPIVKASPAPPQRVSHPCACSRPLPVAQALAFVPTRYGFNDHTLTALALVVAESYQFAGRTAGVERFVCDAPSFASTVLAFSIRSHSGSS